MAKIVCPVWVGYVLLNPLRKLFENPQKLFQGLVNQGMLILEAGCGMGYFTLPLARMVGDKGKVVALDIQEGMLKTLRKRASRRGLLKRIETRLTTKGPLPVSDLVGKVDLVVALHVVHEVGGQPQFLRDLKDTLKPGGHFLLSEPRGHVKEGEFHETVDILVSLGLRPVTHYKEFTSHVAILRG